MKINRRIPAIALALAVPAAMISSPVAHAAEKDITINLGSAAADSEVRLLDGDNKEIDKQTANGSGKVTFSYDLEEAESENLSVEVDGAVIKVTGAKCVANLDGAGDGTDGGSDGTTEPSIPSLPGDDTTDPGTGDDTTDPAPGDDTTDPGTGDDTTDPGTGDDTTDPGTGDDTTDPGTGNSDGSNTTVDASYTFDDAKKISDFLHADDAAQKLAEASPNGASAADIQSDIDTIAKVFDGAVANAENTGSANVTLDQEALKELGLAGDAATEAPGALSGLFGPLTDLLGGLGSGGSITDILQPILNIFKPIAQFVDPLIAPLGGISGVISTFVPQAAPFAPILDMVWDMVLNGASDEEIADAIDDQEGDGTETPAPSDPAPTDPTPVTPIGDEGGAPVSKDIEVEFDEAGLSFVLEQGASVDCDVDTESATPVSDDTDAPVADDNPDTSTTPTPAPAPAAPVASPNVATPGPKVNTGGDVAEKSFFEKVRSIFS